MPVALLPLGTANNIARSLGIAGTPQELVETWKIDRTHPLDIGLVKGSWGSARFLEGFGVGLFAGFLKAADKREKARGADNLRKGRELLEKRLKAAKPIDLSITIDGKSLTGEFFGVEVMNVPFTGPGLPLARKAHVADGLLDIVCFDAGRRRELEKWLMLLKKTQLLSLRGKAKSSNLLGLMSPIVLMTRPTATAIPSR